MGYELYPYIVPSGGGEAQGSVQISDVIIAALQSAWASVFDASCDRTILALRAQFEGLIAEAVEREQPAVRRLVEYIGLELEPDDLSQATAARIAWLPVAELTVDALFGALVTMNKVSVEEWAGRTFDALDQARYMRLTGLEDGKDALKTLERGAVATGGVLADWPGLVNRYGRSVRLWAGDGWATSTDVRPMFFDARSFGEEIALAALDLDGPEADRTGPSLPLFPLCTADGDLPTMVGETAKVALNPFEGSVAGEAVVSLAGPKAKIRIEAVHCGHEGEIDLVVAELVR